MFYIGTNGRTNYIIDTVKDEACTFDYFGQFIGKAPRGVTAMVECKGKCTSVDVISIAGVTGGKECDVFINGYANVYKSEFIDMCTRISTGLKSLRQNTIIYRINHDEGFSQAIFVFREGSLTKGVIDEVLNSKVPRGIGRKVI